MKVVQNNIVKMEWNAEGFIETKKLGFISAIHTYDGVSVAFRDGKIYTHINEDGSPIDFSSLVKTIKQAVRDKDIEYPYFYDDYSEVFDGAEFNPDVLDFLGIADYVSDMEDRLEDLGDYWEIIETELN